MDGQRIMFITNLIAGLLAFTSFFNLKTRKCVSFYSDTGKFPKPYQTRPARQQRSSASSLLIATPGCCKPNAWEELSATISTATVIEAGLTCTIFASFHAGGLALFDSLGHLSHCVAFL
jgi:hypothetical protein